MTPKGGLCYYKRSAVYSKAVVGIMPISLVGTNSVGFNAVRIATGPVVMTAVLMTSTILKRKIAKRKEMDKEKSFDRSKVRMVLICYGCGAPRCVYSNKMIGATGGPTKSDIEEVEQWSEGGYICGGKILDREANLYVQRKLFCGDYVEAQYYNHLGDKKSQGKKSNRKLLTEDVCAICCSYRDVVSNTEIKESRDIGGKNPLLICCECFNNNIKIPTSGGSSNSRESRQQKLASKKRKLDAAVKDGSKVARK